MKGDGEEAGYVAVDALVALAILATVLTLSLQLAASAWQASRTAAELREAQTVLQWSLTIPPSHTAFATNADNGIFRTMENVRVGEIELCRQTIKLEGWKAKRTYTHVTTTICPDHDQIRP